MDYSEALKILGLKASESYNELIVNSKWRKLVKEVHPDKKVGGGEVKATVLTQRKKRRFISVTYKLLKKECTTISKKTLTQPPKA